MITQSITIDDISHTVTALIADTFDTSPRAISPETRPEDISGWDSLGHSVLLTRVLRKFGLDVSEEVAAPIDNVGDLVQRLSHLVGAHPDG